MNFVFTVSACICAGDGVYQRGIDFCIQRLNEGNWIHVFPEGKDGNVKEYGCASMVAIMHCTMCLCMYILAPVVSTQAKST